MFASKINDYYIDYLAKNYKLKYSLGILRHNYTHGPLLTASNGSDCLTTNESYENLFSDENEAKWLNIHKTQNSEFMGKESLNNSLKYDCQCYIL